MAYLGALTAKGYIGQPLHRLYQRTSERSSSSRTSPRNARTWQDLVVWQDFLSDSRQTFAQLDDSVLRFKPKVVANEQQLVDGGYAFGRTAGSADDVKALLMEHVLQGVTQVGRDYGKGVSCHVGQMVC
eukprot:GHRQ01016646.1.p1 GENE.GHRQ01016646.1~~GHRQ01016646.1.p1  ORF type:complete len:129 (-),score=9.75 GHRQ01016646.1:499-885(-)